MLILERNSVLFRERPTFREIALIVIASVSLIGLLALAFFDTDSRKVFLQISSFSIGAVVGYLIPPQK